jgi:hypothetical protein
METELSVEHVYEFAGRLMVMFSDGEYNAYDITEDNIILLLCHQHVNQAGRDSLIHEATKHRLLTQEVELAYKAL